MKNDIDINKIFLKLKKNNPNPKTELNYKNNFELLISVILSAQATDISVNSATSKLFAKNNTPESIIKLGENGLKKHIKSIGLYNTKAKNIIKTCKILNIEYKNIVPNSFNDLIKLPGVGRKTANVVLNEAFNEPTIAVDTHIFRVSRKIGLSNGKNELSVETDLLNVIPKKYIKYAHMWLILHGRYTCTARNPNCKNCCINNYCNFYQINYK
ncbi:MAG: endonuclease III [Gammaproteobacteria bacterium]|jgi:endonuclease III|nr:endonuclease III [Gammaproteobacteria bacterium]MBT7603020.1 endonuclease III [Gammaproteobacteria bacterium]